MAPLDPFFDWLIGALVFVASLIGAPGPSAHHPATAPPEAWVGTSSRCHLVCWYAGALGCEPPDDCGKWCQTPTAMASCSADLDRFFACGRKEPPGRRDCDAKGARTAGDPCAAERRAVNACMESLADDARVTAPEKSR